MSLARPAAGGESCGAGFYFHDNRILAERAFYCCAVVRPAVLLAQRTVLCDSFGKDCVKDKNGA